MTRRILVYLPAVMACGNDPAIQDRNRPDRHLIQLGGQTGLLQGKAHEVFVTHYISWRRERDSNPR